MTSPTTSPRIYLDNAATSWPKPDEVVAAMERFYRHVGVSVGRSTNNNAIATVTAIDQCRAAIGELISASPTDAIVFGFNGTDVLNMAIFGLVRSGDHVVTTEAEHNSVLRPLAWLEATQGVRVEHAPCLADGQVDVQRMMELIQPTTRLVAVTHVSNVTGGIQPVSEIALRCRELEVPLLVDAAQSLGHVPIDVQQMGCDLLAAPGHKGLLGPLGTGVLYVHRSLCDRLEPWRIGGTGTDSESALPPNEWPQKLEAGNMNAAGILGLAEGVKFVSDQTPQSLLNHERALAEQLTEALRQIDGINVFRGPSDQTTGVVSFTTRDWAPADLAAVLDASAGIDVRAGLHCAPLIHRALGTLESGGTVRVSPGPFNTPADIDRLLDVLHTVLG